MPRTPMALLSPADQARLRALRRMKAVALGALIFMAVVSVSYTHLTLPTSDLV